MMVEILRARIASAAAAVAVAVAAAMAAGTAAHAETADPSTTLAVCADPGNLPYSSSKLDGFENRLAALLAADMRRTLRYTWAPQRRYFFNRTLLAGACDVVISVPATKTQTQTTNATTHPKKKTTKVAVTR